MENPHAEKQAILLERIIKNMVRFVALPLLRLTRLVPQEKCNELIAELNKCVKVGGPLYV